MDTATTELRSTRLLGRLLIGFAALIALLGLSCGAVFLLLSYDMKRLEQVLEVSLSTLLNRELQIGEVVDVSLGAETRILAHDVSLANPPWVKETDFARVGRLFLRIDIPSIWRDGPVIIRELELTDASVNLLAPDGRSPTWDFWPDEPVSEEDSGDDVVFPVVFSKATVSNGRLIFRDDNQDINLKLDHAFVVEPDPAELIKLELIGAVNDIPLTARGAAGPSSALMSLQNLRLDLSAQWGELSVVGRGSIADLSNISGPDLDLKISAPVSRPLLDLLGLQELSDGPLELSGHVGSMNPGLVFDVSGSMGDYDMALTGTAREPRELNGLEASLSLQGASLAEIGNAFELEGFPDQPFSVSGDVYRDGALLGVRDGVIRTGEGQLSVTGRLPNFPDIDDWQVAVEGGKFNLAAMGPLLGIGELPAQPYEIKAELGSTDAGLEIVDLHAVSEKDEITLNGSVGEQPDYFGSSLNVHYVGKDLGATALWAGLNDLPHLAFEFSGAARLDSSGLYLDKSQFSSQGLKVTVSGSLDQIEEPTVLQGRVNIESPDLASTLATWGLAQENLPGFPVDFVGEVEGSPSDLRLSDGVLRSGDTRVTVSGDLGNPARPERMEFDVGINSPDILPFLPPSGSAVNAVLPVDIRGDVLREGDTVHLSEVAGALGSGVVKLEGSINAGHPGDASRVDFHMSGPDLEKSFGPWLERPLPTVPFGITLNASLERGLGRVKQLNVTISDTFLDASFDVGNLDDLSDVSGNFKLSGPSSQHLVELLGIDVSVPDTGFTLNSRMKRDSERLSFHAVDLKWGKSDYSGKIDVRLGEIPGVAIDMRSNLISLSLLMPDFQAMEAEEAKNAGNESSDPLMLAGALTSAQRRERVISDEPLDFSWMRAFNMRLNYEADQVYLREGATTSAFVDATLKDGLLKANKVSWDGTFSKGTADFSIRVLENRGAEIDLDLDLRRIPLILLLGGDPHYDPDSAYRSRISTRGGSLREMVIAARGALVFKGGGGQLNNNGLDLLLGDTLDEVFVRLNPFSENETHTTIECHAGAFIIGDGKLDIAPGLVVRTDKMDIAAGGDIELNKETLNITFNSKARKGIGISAGKAITPYFKIGGTMAYPRLALDPKGMAVSGGAAVATAGLSILAEGLWDRWIATAMNPCERLFTEASKKDKRTYKALLARPD